MPGALRSVLPDFFPPLHLGASLAIPDHEPGVAVPLAGASAGALCSRPLLAAKKTMFFTEAQPSTAEGPLPLLPHCTENATSFLGPPRYPPPPPPDPRQMEPPQVGPEAYSTQAAADTVVGGPGRGRDYDEDVAETYFGLILAGVSAFIIFMGLKGHEFLVPPKPAPWSGRSDASAAPGSASRPSASVALSGPDYDYDSDDSPTGSGARPDQGSGGPGPYPAGRPSLLSSSGEIYSGKGSGKGGRRPTVTLYPGRGDGFGPSGARSPSGASPSGASPSGESPSQSQTQTSEQLAPSSSSGGDMLQM